MKRISLPSIATAMLFTLLIPVIVLVTCGEGLGAQTLKTPEELCSTVYYLEASKKREYDEEAKKPGYIGQKDKLKAINQKYDALIDEAWSNIDVIEGWRAVITGISERANDVMLYVELPCNATHHVWRHSLQQTDRASRVSKYIVKGTPAYEALKNFKVGDTVFVTGYHGTTGVTTVDMITGKSHSGIEYGASFIFEGLGKTAVECKAVAEAQRIAVKELAAEQRKKDQKNPLIQGSEAKKALEDKVVRPVVEKIFDSLYK